MALNDLVRSIGVIVFSLAPASCDQDCPNPGSGELYARCVTSADCNCLLDQFGNNIKGLNGEDIDPLALTCFPIGDGAGICTVQCNMSSWYDKNNPCQGTILAPSSSTQENCAPGYCNLDLGYCMPGTPPSNACK